MFCLLFGLEKQQKVIKQNKVYNSTDGEIFRFDSELSIFSIPSVPSSSTQNVVCCSASSSSLEKHKFYILHCLQHVGVDNLTKKRILVSFLLLYTLILAKCVLKFRFRFEINVPPINED